MHGFLQASSPLLFSIFVSVLFLLLYVFVTNKYGTNANTNRKGSYEKKKRCLQILETAVSPALNLPFVNESLEIHFW